MANAGDREYSILHLSDFHLGEDSGEDGHSRENVFYRNPELIADRIAHAITETAPPACAQIAASLSAILITGDVGFRGKIDTDKVAAAVSAIPGLLKVDQASCLSVIILPGNHDQDFTAENGQQGEALAATKDPVESALRKRGYANATVKSCRGEEVVLSLFPESEEDADLAILGFDSAAHMSRSSDRGSLPPSVLSHIYPASKRAKVRIAALHHNLIDFPYPYAEPVESGRCLVNAYKLLDWLGNARYSVVLHGHQHVAFPFRSRAFYPPSAIEAGGPMYILPCGSWYETEKKGDSPNPLAFRHFQVVNLRFPRHGTSPQLRVFGFCDRAFSGNYHFDPSLSLADFVSPGAVRQRPPQELAQELCVKIAGCTSAILTNMATSGLTWMLTTASKRYGALVDQGAALCDAQDMYSFYYNHLFGQAREGDRCFAVHNAGARCWLDPSSVEHGSLARQKTAGEKAQIERVLILNKDDRANLRSEQLVRIARVLQSCNIDLYLLDDDMPELRSYLHESSPEVEVGPNGRTVTIDPGNMMLYESGAETVGFFFVKERENSERRDTGRLAVVTRHDSHLRELQQLRTRLGELVGERAVR